MRKTVDIYTLSFWKKEYARDSGYVEIYEPKIVNFSPEFEREPIAEPPGFNIQQVKVHIIEASESVPVNLIGHKDIPEYSPEAIYKRQKEEVGNGCRENFDDPRTRGCLNPSRIFQTTAQVGFYFSTGVPDLLRRTFDPAYTRKIETENQETARDLHIKSEELRMSNARLKKSNEELKQTKSILDGSITGLLLYRLRQWWKNKNIKEKL